MTQSTVSAATILGNNYEIINIEANTYTPTIYSGITITATVTDVYGDAVASKAITLYQNGTSVSQKTTNSSGVTSWTINMDEFGLFDFRIANKNITVKVGGYRTIMSGSEFNARAYENRVELRINVASTVFTTSFTAFSGQTVPEGYRPRGTVLGICYNNNNLAVGVKTDGTINRRSMTGSNVTGACDTVLSWQY